MMLSIAAMFHQCSLLCRQHCACVCMTKHALSSMQQHNTGALTVLTLHSNYLTSDTLTFLFGSVFGLSKQKPSEYYQSAQRTSSASHSLILFFFLFDSRLQSKCLQDPSQFNLDKVKACCFSVAYQPILLAGSAVSIYPATTLSRPLPHQHRLSSPTHNWAEDANEGIKWRQNIYIYSPEGWRKKKRVQCTVPCRRG